MLFSSITFLYYFLPAAVLLYAAVPRRGKNLALLLASLVFYAWGEQLGVILFAGFLLSGWALGLLIERGRGTWKAGFWLLVSILLGVGFLGYFKYADFFLSSVNAVLGSSLPLVHAALPIGISFYTFQILSYTIDVYRADTKAQRNAVDFAAYVAMFPQLIAGPIVRYRDIEGQLKERRQSLEGASAGISRFVLGLGKKVLIANRLGELCENFRASGDLSVLYFWMYGTAFFFQIYYDFSGYSDMAIGLGKLFGFDFPENFNYPYISKSITEFWRRWHMSLSSWFRDYVYIPLGGNRAGAARQIRNILIVWMLTGLWHGAAWNFVLWGLYFALLLTAEKLWLKRHLDRHPVVGHVYALALVLFGFVLFHAESLSQAAGDFAGLFGLRGDSLISMESVYYLKSYAVTFALAGIGATPVPKRLMQRLTDGRAGEKLMCVIQPLGLTMLLLVVTACLVDGSFNPFLYFRF